jgi:hypothetical protein
MAWTAPRTWTDGELVTAAIMNPHIRDNETLLYGARVRKSADETINNSAALQDDNHLTFAVAASEVWAFNFFIIYNSGTTPDIKIAIGEPSGATTKWTWIKASGGTLFQAATILAGGDAAAQMVPGAAADDVILIDGICTNSTNAGSVTLRWAQNTATVADTIVRTHSYVIGTRIA